jgi:replication factor A1
MRNVNFIGKLIDISPVREFETDRGKGKVVNLTFGDETGSIRLSLWNEKTDIVDQLKQGQVFEVISGYTRKDNLGNAEIRLGRYGNLRKLDGVDIKVVKAQPKYSRGYKKINLDKTEEDDFVIVKASLLQLFERKMIYFVCPSCKTKLDGQVCKKHGEVEKEKLLIVSGVVDDGYGNCNVVFFRNTAERVLNKSVDEVEKEIELNGEKGFFNNLNILGNELVISGIVRKNMFNNIELVAHKVEEVNVKERINNLLGELNG